MSDQLDTAIIRAGGVDRRQPARGRRLSDVLAALCVVADIGLQRSGQGLSEMTGVNIEAMAAQVRKVPVGQVPRLAGGEESIVAGTYLRIEGDIQGHIMLVLPKEDAAKLAAMLLGEPVDPAEEFSDMVQSALGEAGNICSSFFLGALADATGMYLSPSPPAVMVDMGGAVLDSVLAELAMEEDEIFVIDTLFTQSDEKVNAFFLVLPSARYVDKLVEKLPK